MKNSNFIKTSTMYKKIRSEADLKNIKSGSIVTLYPVNGPLKEELNLNEINHEHFEVSAIDESNMTYSLNIPSSDVPDVPIYINGAAVTGIASNEPIMTKKASELIEERNWWIEQN